jgi:hypothetical protein
MGLAALQVQAELPSAAAPQTKMNAITSWGDILVLYGPGTDPSLDSPQAIENMILHWKARGYTGVFMRTDLAQIEPLIRRNPITKSEKAATATGNSNPRLAVLYNYIDRVMEEFDFHQVGNQLGEKHDFEWWAWHPHIYSHGAPETAGEPGVGRIWPWTYVDKYSFEHPEIITVDRKGKKYYMVREFIYDGARKSAVDEFVYMAKALGVKRFIACMRSEATQIQDPPVKADQYGFNEPIVAEMKKRYDVDIMTDPRFDIESASFDPRDPMVAKWQDLRGEYVTQLYRDIRKALREVDPNIEFAVTLSGDHVGPPLGNWRLDWRTWVDEGLIDTIITPVYFEASLDHDAGKKGYLTFGRENIGVLSHQEIKDYIKKSRHPEIEVIATAAPPYLFEPPPSGADGWRTDVWYSAYHLAWYQRWWEQWMPDVKEFGHIKFLQQNFDGFPTDNAGLAGGWGEWRYDPKVRACPGVWTALGDGKDGKPIAVKDVFHGDTGQAMKLTASADESTSLNGFHNAFPDRSTFTSGLDTAITNGLATLEFWVYRPDAASGLSAFVQGTPGGGSQQLLQDMGSDRDIAVRITPETGRLSYSRSENGQSQWVDTQYDVPVGQWQRVSIVVDLDTGVYGGATSSGDNAELLFNDVAVEPAKPRTIYLFNDNKEMEVPSRKMLKQVTFIPEGKPGAITYVDDVALNWKPTLHYDRPRSKVFFNEDFESHPDGSTLNGRRLIKGGSWKVVSETAGSDAFTITNDTSFGKGVNSLHATGGGTMIARTDERMRHIPHSVASVDLDLFIRSDSDFPYIMPNDKTTSSHRVILGLKRKATGDFAATAIASEGFWWIWDESQFVNTKVPVTYDVWNHLQIALHAPSGTYRVVVQPIGEVPTLVGTAKLGEAVVFHDDFEFSIETSDTEGHSSLYDNIKIAAGAEDD